MVRFVNPGDLHCAGVTKLGHDILLFSVSPAVRIGAL
jgi:hypothetical protein